MGTLEEIAAAVAEEEAAFGGTPLPGTEEVAVRGLSGVDRLHVAEEVCGVGGRVTWSVHAPVGTLRPVVKVGEGSEDVLSVLVVLTVDAEVDDPIIEQMQQLVATYRSHCVPATSSVRYSLAEIRLSVQCCICLDPFHDLSYAVQCPHGDHVMCHACFATYVHDRANDGLTPVSGGARCPCCELHIDEQTIEKVVPKSVFREYIATRERAVEREYFGRSREKRIFKSLRADIDEFVTTVKEVADTVDDYDPRGMTALHTACSRGLVGHVRVLLEYGADCKMRTKGGHTALVLGCFKGSAGVVGALLEKDPSLVDEIGCKESTALVVCAKEGFLEGVEVLVAHGANVNISDERGFTPLSHAAKSGCTLIVATLLAAGADCSLATSRQCWNPLHFAVYYRHLPALKLILASQTCDPRTPTSSPPRTPLEVASSRNFAEAIPCLHSAVR